MDWYEKWFGKEYILTYPHRNEAEAIQQVDFLLKHISIPSNSKILDLCCGNGRHAIELKKRGYDVVGVDLSKELLDIALSKACENALDLKLYRCDMREIPYENEFDLVVQFFTSFGYFVTDEENQKVLSAISKALKPDGKFLIDYMNPDYVIANLVERDEKQISDNISIIQERWIENSRINKKITFIENGKTSYYNESVRMYSHQEIENMLSKAGLKLDQTYGNFDASEYNKNSARMILIGRKY